MTIAVKLTWRHCFKQMLWLALPVLGAHLVEALIPFINVTLAASQGEVSLAAAGLVGSTFIALMGFCWGVTASVGIIAANRLGEGATNAKIGLVQWSGFLTTLVLSLPVMIIFSMMGPIWLKLGQDPQVVMQAEAYMKGLLLAVPADLAKFAIFQFAIACGKPRVPLVANIVSIPILVLLSFVLVPTYGMYGIGLGTAITYWTVFAAMFAYILLNPFFKHYLQHRPRANDMLQACQAQLKLGVPIGLMFSIELTFFMFFTLLIGSLGSKVLAANQIAMQWMWLTVMFVYGFTEAVTILVAKANGAKEVWQIRQFAYAGMFMSTLCMVIVASVYWFAPHFVISFDMQQNTENIGLIALAISLLAYCGIYQIVDGLRIILSGALRGIEDSRYPMWVATLAFWLIALPIGYVSAFHLKLNAQGFWIGLISAVAVSTLLQYQRLMKKASQNHRLTR